MTRPAPHRTVRQPGLPTLPRIAAVPVGTVPIDTLLMPGQTLLDALAALMTEGIDSACLTLSGGALHPFAFVIPALSPDGSQAAFYSAAVQPPGHTALDTAAVTVGWRGDTPFFHCHALWTTADGARGCGHVLPGQTVIAAPIHASGAGIVGARFEVHPDAETGFSLFTPRPTGTAPCPGARPAVALRLAPNQDLIETLEHAARTAGFTRARVHGGVASINEARFLSGPPVTGFATELLVRRGMIESAPALLSELDIAIVDLLGTVATGHLVPGDNPVLMTFEGVLERA